MRLEVVVFGAPLLYRPGVAQNIPDKRLPKFEQGWVYAKSAWRWCNATLALRKVGLLAGLETTQQQVSAQHRFLASLWEYLREFKNKYPNSP